MRTLFRALFLHCLLTLPAMAAGQMVASNPWIREAPPGVSMWAGFVSLKNTSEKPVALVRASSPAFHMVEMHRSVVENGVVRMREQERIVIPAGQTVALKPGGYHLMLMHARQPIRAGVSVPITLSFDNGQNLRLTFPVKRGQ